MLRPQTPGCTPFLPNPEGPHCFARPPLRKILRTPLVGPPYHIYAFGHGVPLQIFRKLIVAKLANKRLVAYQGPGADPGEDVGDAPLTSHFQQCFG